MKKPKHLLKEWENGLPKSECGKLVEERDTTVVLTEVTCGQCKRAKGYKKVARSRFNKWLNGGEK